MRSNAAVYIDAGYLLASAATRLTGSSFRQGIQPDYPKLINGVLRQAEEIAGRPVLRSYWYDAAPNQSPDSDQRVIEMVPRVKLRLGRIGNEGQQKGVDLKIGLDMVTHARNGAIDTLVLISGDDDLTEAVDQAQVTGVEVIVLAVPDATGRPHGVSRHLHAAADRLDLLNSEMLEGAIAKRIAKTILAGAVANVLEASAPVIPHDVDAALRHPSPVELARPKPTAVRPTSPPPAAVPVYSTASGDAPSATPQGHAPLNDVDPSEREEATQRVVRAVLGAFLGSATQAELVELKASRPSIPRELDSTLLRDLSDVLQIYSLTDSERHGLRNAFWAEMDAQDV
ncbi:NYN domain-containing protein [Demequina muriae]|uniref:NYN domain-containing protein n=1 Tax=Demequina muriae TaxID=3051664 RepID=A0ABT8GE63_9MICO|nr:NYN domain-containing protein [Demequina sp. EGI L300058]MDN4479720.1 NYN domain-containing protein [Demequina sp. EGI L300058]